MDRTTSRREFLRRSAAGGAGLALLANSLSARAYGANEKLNVALIGVGGRGRSFVNSMPKRENVVAMCDCNDQRSQPAYRAYPKLPKFHDFRVMIDKMQKEIDAVVIAAPDHIHAPASSAAIRAGMHVYVEKPMTRTVREARVLRELATKHKAATSMGNQGTASAGLRQSCELIRDGVLGTVTEVHGWNNQGGPDRKEAPKDTAKIPYYLKWDLWLGPAKFREFHPKWMAWHGWRDFGTGNLGNWASHTLNMAFKALKIDSLWHADPATKPLITVEAKVSAVNKLSFPKWEHVRWDFPKRGDLPPISFHWHNGSGRPGVKEEISKLLGREVGWGPDDWGDWARCLVVGAEGNILTNAHNTELILLPEEKFKDVDRSGPKKLPRSRGHETDWLDACRGGTPAWANFDYAGPLTESNMLGNVATQFEGKLEYDPLAGRIVNNPAADKMLHDEYREGWVL
ncbi:Gfo/Idh/MocA family oxidoreductase [bacterium]|nr:Gfo/Idh/MocA family oxidoreductase [bacterium]